MKKSEQFYETNILMLCEKKNTGENYYENYYVTQTETLYQHNISQPITLHIFFFKYEM